VSFELKLITHHSQLKTQINGVLVIPFGSAMAVNPELLKILVCPLCKTPVSLTENGLGLKCSQCRRVYPIRDDIPVMLISEAKVED
jgi:uncharacterized protein YbaR (Trm112 family)